MRAFIRTVVALAAFACSVASAQHELTGELAKPGAGARRDIVLVAGATGRTGRLVVGELAATRRYEVRPLARDPARARAEVGDGYAWVRADVTRPETLDAAMSDVTYVICAIGATARSGLDGPEFVDYGGVKNLVDAARRAGVRQFVLVSSMGVGGEGGFTRWILNFIGGDVLVWKAKGEAHLRSSGLPYVIVRPGGLTDEPGGQRGLRLSQDDSEFGRISRADTAAVAVAVLGQADALGKTFGVIEDVEVPVGAWRSAFAGLGRDAP